ARRERVGGSARLPRRLAAWGGEPRLRFKQAGEAQHAEAHAATAEEFATRDRHSTNPQWGHRHDFSGALGKTLPHYIPMCLRQREVASLEAVRQAGVLDGEAVEDGRVQIMDVHRVARDVVAVIVGLAELEAGANAAAGHPEREAAAVMIAAV